MEDRQRPVSGEWGPAGAERVEHAAEAEQIRLLVDRLAAPLFGCHVLRRADDDSVLGEAGIIGSPREPEVGDLARDVRSSSRMLAGLMSR